MSIFKVTAETAKAMFNQFRSSGLDRQLTSVLALAPSGSVTLLDNATVAFELISNTQLKIKVRGNDGNTRSVTLTLS